MKSIVPALLFTATAMSSLRGAPTSGSSLQGDIRVHDPSTIAKCAGRYYVYSTGPGIPMRVSDDGVTWRRGPAVFPRIPESVRQYVPENEGRLVWAPDVTHDHGTYYLYYSVSKWMGPRSAVGLVTSPTLDPQAPGYAWTDRGMVVHSRVSEGMDAIDPGVLRGPDNRWWLTYGSYRGTVNVIELDPATGLRRGGDNPSTPLADHAEASDMIFAHGWYFLFINRGSCCKGPESTYHIMMGRSSSPRGPFLDRAGRSMLSGGGETFLASQPGRVGPGHFGLLVDDKGERFSCHYEADAAHGNRSALDLRPLLWSADGWPQAGG